MPSGDDAPSGPTRRAVLIGLGAVGAGAALTGLVVTRPDDEPSRRAPTDDRHPNVLYVTADDLGTRLGAYGHPLISTPRIDAFAEEALLFERAYAQIAICGASRSSILTGLRPETTGVMGNADQWQDASPGAMTLMRRFRDAGYRTYGVGKIEDPRNGPLDDPWDERWKGNREAQPAEALDLLDQVAEGDGPWLAAIGFHQPHCPWDPTERSLARYEGVDVMPEAGPQREVFAGFIPECTPETRPEVDEDTTGRVTLGDDEVADIVRRYLASVTDVDTMFGEVLDRAADRGLLENTIVIFWSGDHGFQLGDNGWGKWTCYDAATRIPLIMQLPDRASAGERATGLVEAVDMYPTLVELCGLEDPPQELDGVSFAPVFEQPDRTWKSAAFNTYGRSRSVKTDRYNLIVRDDDTIWLFDLVEDPDELDDLSTTRPDLVADLKAILAAGPAAALPPP